MTSTGPEGGASTGVEAGAENELRLRRRLWNDRAALKAVRELGLADGTMRRFRLGMREPYLAGGSGTVTTRALTFPVPNADGTRTSKWSYLNVEGLTMHAPHPQGWGAGAPRTCYSGPVTAGSSLLVVPTPLDMWLLWQRVADSLPGLIVACPSHPAGVPVEWRRADYWRGWRRVVLGLGGGADHDEVVQMVLRTADREIARCQPPGGESWADLVRTGGSAPEIGLLFEGAQPCVPRAVPAAAGPGLVTGDFEAAPLAIEGAVRDGRMFYPVTVERREVERGGRECGSVVQRYVTRVLRSDGVLLDVERLPAPRGTPSSGRVLALSDGTRILSAPKPGPFGTWRYGSIKAFIEARERGVRPVHRSVDRLAADVEAHLRSSVWLPHEADYALSTAFVLATFVHRVFDALPILLVNGAKGSGKSELGQAFASLCFNGLVAGRVTAAGLIRLMAESRGTVVLDDMESIGSASAAARDLIQILKTSYKAATARRLGSGRDGATETVDYFGPKVITNITGADAVLSSRMLAIRTRQMAEGDSLMDTVVDVAALRDELHCWAMCEAEAVGDAYRPLAAAARNRRDELAAPLRAVATVVGRDGLSARLETALAHEPQAPAEPLPDLVVRALRRLVAEEAADSVAMPHLLLEMASLARGPFEAPSAETVGRTLLAVGARTADGRIERRRLHGEVTRIYRLDARFQSPPGTAAGAYDPFGFCQGPCTACRYEGVCPDVVPSLRRSKRHGVDA